MAAGLNSDRCSGLCQLHDSHFYHRNDVLCKCDFARATTAFAKARPQGGPCDNHRWGFGRSELDEDQEIPVEEESTVENTPLFVQRQNTGFYSLDETIELGELASLFFSKCGVICFYFCISIYLYGDLSIYAAAVAKSVTDILCSNSSSNATAVWTEVPEECWSGMPRYTLYQINIVAFVAFLGPFVFFNVQKTKYIQILTIIFRCLAFSIMIIIASSRFFTHEADGAPPKADFNQVSNLFGACIYSFMCHHSLPALITPIQQKRHLKFALSLDYVYICGFYLVLALTGAFAFRNLYDLYTLNFIPSASETGITFMRLVEYFLALFPVFTLSASFPIIAITLRNNLQFLFLDMANINSYGFVLRRLFFPLLTLIPPIIVTTNTENIHSLVKFTGSYAGTGIQYIIPIALVYSARKRCQEILGRGIVNVFSSPFRSDFWLLSVLIWTGLCVCLVTVNIFNEEDWAKLLEFPSPNCDIEMSPIWSSKQKRRNIFLLC